MNYQLLQGDCLTHMAGLPDASVDAIIADPPYMTTNLHFDKGEGMDWAAWWVQAWRVVKPAGVVVLFAADLFTVDLILTQRANYRYRLVWEKSRPSGFLDANRRPLRAHEDIVLFMRTPKASTYNVQKTPRTGPNKGTTSRTTASHYGAREATVYTDDGTRHPTTVLSVASVESATALHPTQKPLDLMRWLVRTYTNPGETVLDCFAGSGSTLHACLLEGRLGVGIEQDAGYFATATKRLQQAASTPSLFATV